MRRVALLLAALTVLGAPIPAAQAFSRCGNVKASKSGGVFIGRIHTSGMGCREARWVVRRFHGLGRKVTANTFESVADDDGSNARVFYRYRGRRWRTLNYSYKKIRYEAGRNQLRNGRRRITWFTAS